MVAMRQQHTTLGKFYTAIEQSVPHVLAPSKLVTSRPQVCKQSRIFFGKSRSTHISNLKQVDDGVTTSHM